MTASPLTAAKMPIPTDATAATVLQAPSRLSIRLNAFTRPIIHNTVSARSTTEPAAVSHPSPAANRPQAAPAVASRRHFGATAIRSSTVPISHMTQAPPSRTSNDPAAPPMISAATRNATSTAAPPRSGVGAACWRYCRGRSRKSVR